MNNLNKTSLILKAILFIVIKIERYTFWKFLMETPGLEASNYFIKKEQKTELVLPVCVICRAFYPDTAFL